MALCSETSPPENGEGAPGKGRPNSRRSIRITLPDWTAKINAAVHRELATLIEEVWSNEFQGIL